MWDLFKAEVIRFRGWAIAYAAVHLMVLGFLTRVVDLAQQPLMMVYMVIGGVYALTGLLLGLYQMGGYRRPNAWLNLLHRPLPHWQVATALFGAGTLLLAVAVLLPLLVIAGWQETMTARVLDLRHLLLVTSAWLVSVCGYLAGGSTMLGNKRYSVSALVPLLLLFFSNATGIGAIAMQLLVIAWLAAMIVFGFKPDLAATPRNPIGVVVNAVPLQVGLWFAFLMVGFGLEMVWIMQGSHPNNLAMPVPGSAKEADNAEGKDVMVAGLKTSTAAEAPLWREQAAISDVFTIGPNVSQLPAHNELTNIAPMEFDDETRRVRWVFSHDSMRFEGYNLASSRAAGRLGVEGDGAFQEPPLPGPQGALITRSSVYQYDSDAKLVLPRAHVPRGETIVGLEIIGERVALLSDRALYIYDGRELQQGDGVLTPRWRVPVPGITGTLQRIDLMELLDGYLVSFAYTRWRHNGDGPSYQQILRVDGPGQVTSVARRELTTGYGVLFRYQNWYPSPAVFALQRYVVNLFSSYTPGNQVDRQPIPRSAMAIAGALMLVSWLGAIWYVRRTTLSLPARIAWVVACGVISIPALLSLWLLYPERERLDELPLAHAATA
ncbi:hypothetical protein [Lysobacter sp. CFH 32150]|uniref:hypothetical protein n=1 Tax=Lysobacter sp. CFH 32150 TaxID=2927128 RepID=UPI001FA6DA6E|nr:hypothetical protein [Lysobacter sp. CFH 32150]MCI4567500.1 hypothetical protein [Lysobacter sp. CFH 32150]